MEQASSESQRANPPVRQVGAIADLSAAYVRAWGEIDNVVKNANNPHFGSTYADLGAVIDVVKPVFFKHDLALMTVPGELDGDKMSLVWMLIHSSGQMVNGRMSVPIGNKATAQAAGSCITYMRRYLTAAIGGLAQVDDDGNAASSDKPERAPRAKAATTYAETASSLTDRIEAAADLAALEALKAEIAELGDQKIANAYVARKKALKGVK